MREDFENQRKKQANMMRSLLDYGMGLLIMAAGIFFFFREHFNIALNERRPPDELDKIFGVLCFLYGAWRMYRGYRKNYYK